MLIIRQVLTGAKLYITARQMEKGHAVAKDLTIEPERPVEVIKIELDSFSSIRAGVKSFLDKSSKLNALVCNAGIMAPPEGKTQDGFELQFGTNHLGHLLLFQLLKDVLINSSSTQSGSRVISVSSCGHRSSGIQPDDYNFGKGDAYNKWLAYGQSKTAGIYFANEIERRYSPHGVHAWSLHPGVTNTKLSRHLQDDPVAAAFMDHPLAPKMTKSIEQGAATSVWAAVGASWRAKVAGTWTMFRKLAWLILKRRGLRRVILRMPMTRRLRSSSGRTL